MYVCSGSIFKITILFLQILIVTAKPITIYLQQSRARYLHPVFDIHHQMSNSFGRDPETTKHNI